MRNECSATALHLPEAQRIAIEVVDRLMEDIPHWQAAELRQRRASFLRR
jgi:hypothetical protein